MESLTAKLLLFATFVFSMLMMSLNHRKKRKRIVFFGDSITEQGARPGGYIKYIEKLLTEEGINDDYNLVGAGVGGNKVTDLQNRLARDVLADGADVVIIFIGINDVWHKQKLGNLGTDEKTFSTVYRSIIEKLQLSAIKVVVCTPTVIGERTDLSNEQDDDLEIYSEIIRNLSIEYYLPLVDLRQAFLDYIELNKPENSDYGILTHDKVHLNSQGNKLVAQEMWKVLQQVK